MKSFDNFPGSIKKTLRYINQDVKSIKDLEQIEQLINKKIMIKKK